MSTEKQLPQGYQIERGNGGRLYVSYVDDSGIRRRVINNKGKDKFFYASEMAEMCAEFHAKKRCNV